MDAGVTLLYYYIMSCHAHVHVLCNCTGIRAYAKALQLCPERASLWHDLAVGYQCLGKVATALISLVSCLILKSVFCRQQRRRTRKEGSTSPLH